MATLLTVAKEWTQPRCQVTGKAIKEMWSRDFFGSPVVRAPHFHCRGWGSVPGRGTEILQVVPHGQKNKKEKKKEMQSIRTREYHMRACSVLSNSL